MSNPSSHPTLLLSYYYYYFLLDSSNQDIGDNKDNYKTKITQFSWY